MSQQQAAKSSVFNIVALCFAGRDTASAVIQEIMAREASFGYKVRVWAVWAIELHPPKGVEPLEWMLLSTRPVLSAEDAVQCLRWYARRFSIELWHKILKSGCRIEAHQLSTEDRLERCYALYCVIAWRILYATWLGREAPELPCTVLLEEAEWQALYCMTHRSAELPFDPPCLRDAVRWIGKLGGFIGRKSDKEPGITSLWRGFQRLADITAIHSILRPVLRPR